MITYRLATKDDNQQLIELTADSGMDGEIALRIDRNPDFFKLVELRGDSRVYVAEEDQRIVGSLCVSCISVYIAGELVPVHYIGDFKVAKSHRERGIGMTLTNTVAKYLMSIDADLVFLNVSKGNAKPFSFFENRSVGTDFEQVALFNIFQLIGKRNKKSDPEYKIETSEISDEIVEFLARFYRKYELGAHINHEKLKGTEIFTIRQKESLLGAMCLMDTMDIKQNIVTNVSRKMSLMLKLINTIGPVFGMSKMPVLHEPVRMIYVKYIAMKQDEKVLFQLLINHARNMVYKKGYSFLALGFHEKDPMTNYLAGMSKFTFRSVGMLSSLKASTSLVNSIKVGVSFEDYSLI